MNIARSQSSNPSLAHHGILPLSNWYARLLVALMIILGISLVLDQESEPVNEILAWIILGLGGFLDRAKSPGRMKWFTIFALAGLIPILAAIAGGHADQLKYYVKYVIPVMWLVNSWLASAWFFSPADAVRRGPVKLCRTIVMFAMAFAWISTLSAFFGIDPKKSLKLFGSELLTYIGLFFIIGRLSISDLPDVRRIMRLGLGLQVLVSIVAVVMASWFIMAWPGYDVLERLHVFRAQVEEPGMHRFRFMLNHHNRAGLYFAVVAMLGLIVLSSGRIERLMGVCLLLSSAVCLPITSTRAAVLACLVGFLVYFVIILIRFKGTVAKKLAVLGVVALAVIVLLAQPGDYRRHFLKIFDVGNYSSQQVHSIGSRLLIWRMGVKLVSQEPLIGHGYGTFSYEAAAASQEPDDPDHFRNSAHAHNQWLETMVESGAFAMLALLGFTVARWMLWWVAWRRARLKSFRAQHILAAWMAMEVTLQMYGLTNYALRKSLGFLVYSLWALHTTVSLYYLLGPGSDHVAENDTPVSGVS